jgi:hypothetical protein
MQECSKAAAEVGDGESTKLTAICNEMVRAMLKLAEPTMRAQRRAEVASRIKQLEIISKNTDLLASLDRKFAMAFAQYSRLSAADKANAEAVCINTAAKLAELRTELQQLEQPLAADATLPKLTQSEYESLLTGDGKSPHLPAILKALPTVSALIQEGMLTQANFAKVLSRAGFLTCPQTDLLPPAMPAAYKAIEKLEAEEALGLLETPLLKQDLSVLYACYNKAAIPNMYVNFLRNYRENPKNWPSLYTGHKRRGLIRSPVVVAETSSKVMVFEKHVDVANKVAGSLSDFCDVQRSINDLKNRIYSQQAQAAPGGAFVVEETAEPFQFQRRLAAATVAALQKKQADLEKKLTDMKAASGVPVDLLSDLIRNELVVGKK